MRLAPHALQRLYTLQLRNAIGLEHSAVPKNPTISGGHPMLTAAAGQTLATGTRSPRLPPHARSARSTKLGAASHSTGHAAFPRGRCLLLGLLAMARAASASVYANKADLEAALEGLV